MLEKLSSAQLKELLDKFCSAVLAIPQLSVRQIILFGSYARGDADEESDVDLMILTDIPREQIPSFRRDLVRISSSLGLEYGPMISPTMQNSDFFTRWAESLPFYRNVRSQGVSIHAS